MPVNTLIVILGPTAVGKTETTLCLADFFHSPIINADSRQIFQEIPIGTAAPTMEQQLRAKHYFVGNHHIDEYYSASLFEEDVLNLLQTIWKTNSVAIMSGGSMMYIDAVCNGIDDIPTVDDQTRMLMKRRLEEEGLPKLVEELKILDFDHWQHVDKNNPRRVLHALEICHMTGKPYSSFLTNKVKKRPFRIIKIGLNLPRDVLYARINSRVVEMIEHGMIDEAKRVLPYRHCNALNTVGYKELFEYFEGALSLDEAIAKIQSNTRRYARKQLTWYKRDASVTWFEPSQNKQIIQHILNEMQTDTAMARV